MTARRVQANGGFTASPVSYAFNANATRSTLSQFNAPASSVLLCEVFGAPVRVDQADEGFIPTRLTICLRPPTVSRPNQYGRRSL